VIQIIVWTGSDCVVEYGLPEYWIVDPKQHCIEIYRKAWRRLELAGKYQIDDEVESAALTLTSFKASRIFPDAGWTGQTSR
jgi:Uma2 family endonuclease